MNRPASIVLVVGLAVAIAGCQRLGLGGSSPAPLPATPLPPVDSQPLTPLDGVQSSDTLIEQQPLDPVEGGGEQVASAAPFEAPAEAKEIGRSDLLGGWTMQSAADQCQLFMTLTTWSGGYRANTRGCGSPALQGISAWDLTGKQVVLKNDAGETVANLYSSGGTQFNGQTSAGQPITVFR